MRFMHIADLHIGKRVHRRLMLDEQRNVVAQLHEAARTLDLDAVLIAGDVFDRPNPSREALELAEELYAGFLALGLEVFVIPGNHDSAAQVAYCSSINEAAGLHIAKAYDGTIPVYALEDESGPVHVHLLPFVRPLDVRVALELGSDEVASHSDAVAAALAAHGELPQGRNVLVAHQFVIDGGQLPETCESETVSVGGIDSVQAALFDDFDYVALGHLHGRQKMRRPEVRYAGSPLKYSFSEVGHAKSATIVELTASEVLISEVPITPLHDMRELRASFAELEAGIDAGDHNDYLHITLTDRTLYDAMSRVEALYPNLLCLDWADSIVVQGEAARVLTHMKGQTLSELFASFYQDQTGKELTEEELALFSRVVEERGGYA